jgi:hypothetical protein
VLDRASDPDGAAVPLAAAVQAVLPRIESLVERPVLSTTTVPPPPPSSSPSPPSSTNGGDLSPLVSPPTTLLAAGGQLLAAIQRLQPYAPTPSPGGVVACGWGGIKREPTPICRLPSTSTTGVGIIAATSADVVLVLTTAGQLLGVGKNKGGLFGVCASTMAMATEPFPVVFPAEAGTVVKITSVAARNHVLATTTTGAVFSWGAGDNGQLGHGNSTAVSSPKRVAGLDGHIVVGVACGSKCSAAVRCAF